MKKLALSFISCITCLCFIISPMCCGATGELAEEILEDTVFSYMLSGDTSEDNQFSQLNKKAITTAWNYALNNATLHNNQIELKMPSFDIITGKATYSVQFEDGGTYTWTVEVTSVMCTAEMAALYNYASTSTGGDIIYANAFNVTITKPSGVTKYVIEMPANYNYNSNVTVGNDRVTIAVPSSGVKLYGYNNGTKTLMASNFSMSNVIFNTMAYNSSDNDVVMATVPTGNYKQYPIGIYSGVGGSVPSSSPLRYPLDVDILHNNLAIKYMSSQEGNTSFTGKTYRPLQYLYVGFLSTNSHSSSLNSYWTDNSKQNYYIYPVSGGTTIDKNNYTDYSNQLAPVFTLDPELPDVLDVLSDLIPAILDLLSPDIDLSLTDLLGRLLDFFGHMPDIGLQWDPDLNLNPNNYFDVELPSLPGSGGGGGGSGGDITVNVDITRPKIPEVNTEPHVSIYYPTVTTTAIPPTIISAGKEFVDLGKDITDMCGTTNIIVICGLIGVGVMLIFKDW